MFSKMIQQLKEGEIPDLKNLSDLLKVALIKKQGVLQQPPACWSNDPKINPDSGHILWAAVLLGLEEDTQTAVGIFISEINSRPGKVEKGQDLAALDEKLMELVRLAPTAEFAEILKEKAERADRIISKIVSEEVVLFCHKKTH